MGKMPSGCSTRFRGNRDAAASYLAAGFVHGVLNSDNINITGESFDYGPWRFNPKLGSPSSPPLISTITGCTRSAVSPKPSTGIWRNWPAACR